MSSALSRPARPPRRQRAVRTVLAAAVLAVLAQLWAATPAAAHAELVDSTPGNGARLERAPAQVTLTFTEHVTLVNGGLRLLGPDGTDLATPAPTVSGRTVRWPMPADLPDGRYLANWRLVSADGHPVSGAVAFGIGTAATAAPEPDTETSAPWPVISARYLGYLGFALTVGVLAFLVLCRPDERAQRAGATLIRAGLVLGLVATLLSFLVQGPYVAGVSQGHLLDPALLGETLATSFGVWLVWRGALYITLVATSWRPVWFEPALARWLVGGLVLALAATFPGTGHGAASGALTDRLVDGVHVLTAGVWVGGLVMLAMLGRSATAESVRRFSTLAATSVGLLVLTGTVNSLLEIPRLSALWDSTYGRLLLVKLGLVGLALLAASVSRRAVGGGGHPWRSVRVEAMAVVVVLAVTSTLALTTPPPTQATVTAADPAAAAATGTSVVMNLGDGRSADLHLTGLTVAGTDLHLILTDASGRPLTANRVELRASMPGRDIAPVEVPLQAAPDGWSGRFQFPLQGVWKLILTVEDRNLTAVVTAGEVAIRT